jgi:hypothetical protein
MMMVTSEQQRRRGKITLTIVGLCVITFATIGLVYAVKGIAQCNKFQATALKAQGISVGKERVHTDGGTRYAPVYAYRDQAGKSRNVTDYSASDLTLGRTATVYYLPSADAEATLDPDADLVMSVAFLVATVVTLGMGIWVIAVARRM